MNTKRSARCGTKRRHASEGKAEAAARSLKRLEPDVEYVAYPCPFCRAWHVGHKGKGNPGNKYMSIYATDCLGNEVVAGDLLVWNKENKKYFIKYPAQRSTYGSEPFVVVEIEGLLYMTSLEEGRFYEELKFQPVRGILSGVVKDKFLSAARHALEEKEDA